MVTFIAALVTVMAWGTWIAVAQAAGPTSVVSRTFYVTIGNAILAVLTVADLHSGQQTAVFHGGWWLPFGGGVIWSVGNLCAFVGVQGLGIARAAGLWTGLNIITALVWGALLFHEFETTRLGIVVRLIIALILVMTGLLIIMFARGDEAAAGADRAWRPVLTTLAAGVLWGTYFVPAQASGLPPRLANVPLAFGMFAGAAVMLGLTDRRSLLLERRRAYGWLLLAGAMWGVGNLGLLVLVGLIGSGQGFTVAQLGLIVNALVGILFFHNPRLRSRAAAATLCGAVLATVGGVLVGQSR